MSQDLGAWLDDPRAVRGSRDADGTVRIHTPDAIARYLRSIGFSFAERLPNRFDCPLVSTRSTTVLVATA